ncbi:MAG TPA: cobaltochelatase subunit CobN [Rhodospirillaceae bacterium]|nr:cobaltochelatase subunit CobN [Rhodospirillaceae bacterium]
MHLLNAQPGVVADGSEAVDLGQTPGRIVVLSAADTELAGLAGAREELGGEYPTLRLANLMQLSHHMSVDLYCEALIAEAELVIVRLLGGVSYWPYGVEQIAETCRGNGVALAFLPGDDQPDEELAARSNLPADTCHRLWQYCVHGGPDNAREFLRFASSLIGASDEWLEPKPLLKAGLYWPGVTAPGLETIQARWAKNVAVAPIVFYRAHLQSGNLAAIDELIEAATAEGLAPLPLFISSLKDHISDQTLREVFATVSPKVILNTTGFAVSTPGAGHTESAFDSCDCPVLQVILSGSSSAVWREDMQGLSPRDIAMNVALPEVDGRIITRAVSFKGEARYDPTTEHSVVGYEPAPDRVQFVARLAANWCRLGRTPASERHIAIVLANYPNRDGRLGNGVGLDTPASVVGTLEALAAKGYDVSDMPADGDDLIARLQAGPTNEGTKGRKIEAVLSLREYERAFDALPKPVRLKISERWGAPAADPFFLADRDGFAVSAFRCGNLVIGLQPARGYNIDPQASYHDPDLAPPHGYLAFYIWLRECFGADAVIHFGKHGNLEWLPGKALALSADCLPEAVFGPIPHLYPFIVNDPGEGAQAKRRAQAVIVDHLTPPLTRAESYGPLAELELLVDEYFEASGVDPRRCEVLGNEILEKTLENGLADECGITAAEERSSALAKLDGYLCELKELQIRDGLHIFGQAPVGRQLTDLLVALARLPRGEQQSLHRALAKDLGLANFDPLDCDMSAPWKDPVPDAMAVRTQGDLVEAIEHMSEDLVSGRRQADENWHTTREVLAEIERDLRPSVTASAELETDALLAGLEGHFVAPGPSGAPTRGRPDVLPTGRNFYSVDTRTVPTPAAWTLGWKSAMLLAERYAQDHGDWPKHLALSVWGTSNMRTGGDDIAQALALLGVQPVWEPASRRVTGFEVMPLDVLGRPRVDVTLRVSGFFRDAFPAQIDLFDSAVRAVAQLEESAEDNPLAAKVHAEAAQLVATGLALEDAERQAGYRVFGSKPGAYGAGLQALIDEQGWQEAEDLARAYIAWSGYAYGNGAAGAAAHNLFERRLGNVEAVLHNQDNREHDLLDSDDYYQFEGGLVAAVEHVSGDRPKAYHNDHSRPESPKIRSLDEEIARVVRARAANPKWIAGVMRHGYKGGFEMAATVDYLFAFAATTGSVSDTHFDLLFDAYIEDREVLEFLQDKNAAALTEMAARFLEALDRGLWQPKSNSAPAKLAALAGETGSKIDGRAAE